MSCSCFASGIGKVRATFVPRRSDDLRPEALLLIGQRLLWRFQWVAEPDERFAGQKIFMPEVEGPYNGWVPECDLEDVEVVEPFWESQPVALPERKEES